MTIQKVILSLLFLPVIASAQSFNVFDIDTSEYPIMKAKFYSIDENGEQILNHTTSDFEITENGNSAEVLSVSCPDPLPIPISVGIMVDTYSKINLARHGAERFVNFLNMPQNELGITYMDGRPLLYRDFTNDKKKARESSRQIPRAPGYTNVENMFFDDFSGGIKLISDRETQNRVLIYISDLHCPNLTVDEPKLIQQAKDNNIRIYSVLLGTNDYTGLFRRIASNTNGVVFENLKDSLEIEDVFNEILFREQNDPCEISWKSNFPCKLPVRTLINDEFTNLSYTFNFSVSAEKLSILTISPNYIDFGEVEPNTTVDTIITLNSINKDLTILNAIFKPNERFELLDPLPINLIKGEDKKIKIRFSPQDSLLNYSLLELVTEDCSKNIGLLGGYKKQKIQTKTLKLTHPNGNEVFYSGIDTTINWEGLSGNELLSFKFSSDNGLSWEDLSDDYIDQSKQWNIPLISSDSCLILVSQIIDRKQEGKTIFSRIYGGTYDDQIRSIIQTKDGGILLVGLSISKDGDFISNNGSSDFSVLKFDKNSKLEWTKNFGGSRDDILNTVIQTKNGDFIAVGYSNSSDKDLNEHNGSDDLVVLKFSRYGDFIWSKSFGGSRLDEARSAIATNDGGVIAVGYSESKDGDILENRGGTDILIVEVDSNGEIMWSETYGGNKDDETYSIIRTKDGGFVICGGTSSSDGDFNNNSGEFDVFVMKFDFNAKLEWSRLYGGSKSEYAKSIIQTDDEGFMLSGYSYSSDGDVNENNGVKDILIYKLDKNGNLLWTKIIGGSGDDESFDIKLTKDNNAIILANSHSTDGDLKTNNGDLDFWLIKIAINGNILWSSNYGGFKWDKAFSLLVDNEGDYVVAATTYPEVPGHPERGGVDILLHKIAGPPPPLQSDTSDAVFSIIMPEPVIQNNDIDMGEMIVGNTKDTIVSSVICNTGDAPLHVLGVDITGGDDIDFLIPRGAGDFYLEKDECQDMMFEFTPSALGNRTAVATIRTTIGDFTDTINIRGVGINPLIEATTDVVDFGQFELGDSKDTTVVLIENVGSTDITITETRITGPDLEQFTLLTSPTNFIIPAGNNKELKLNYTARYGGRTSSIIEFHYDGVGSPLRSMLFAEGIGGEVYPQVPDAYVGDRVELGLYLGRIKPEGLDEVATNFTATVSYNSTLLAPIDKNMSVTTENTTSYIEIEGQLSGAAQIATVPMKVGLGTAVSSGLVVTEFQLYDANGDSVDYEIEPGVGEFNVLGICEEGGTRLVNPNSEKVGLRVAQNKLNTSATIYLDLIESGQTDLIIYDQLGNAIETAYSGTPNKGLKELSLDLSNYTNGRYYIKLTTPTITKTEIIEIVR